MAETRFCEMNANSLSECKEKAWAWGLRRGV